jgi:putative phosphoribosyl transferase
MSKQTAKPWTGAVASFEDQPVSVPGAARFQDRHDAGRRLAALLEPYREQQPIVVGIPRGGGPVAAEVARVLNAPLDVAVVRKISAPRNPEYAIGALAEGDVHVLNSTRGLSGRALRALIGRVEDELDERLHRYRGASAPIELAGRTVILIDDGLATGSSALAAIGSLRKRGAARVILAVPVAAPASVETLRHYTDEVVCVEMPVDLWAVGCWYEDFRPTSDEEVAALLRENASSVSQPPRGRP